MKENFERKLNKAEEREVDLDKLKDELRERRNGALKKFEENEGNLGALETSERHVLDLDEDAIEEIPLEQFILLDRIRMEKNMDEGKYERYAEEINKTVLENSGEGEIGEEYKNLSRSIRPLLTSELIRKRVEFEKEW